MPKSTKIRSYKGYIYLENCPRCGSENRKMYVIGTAASTSYLAKCKDCELEITSRSSEYIRWLWNEPKKVYLNRVLQHIAFNPYTYYVSADRLQIVGRDNLISFLEDNSDWEFDLKQGRFATEGYIVGRKGYV